MSSGGPLRSQGSRGDTPPGRFGTVRPLFKSGPPTKKRIQIEVFACSVWRMGVTGRSQIFLGLGGGSPVQVDFEPSIELATAIAQPIYQYAHGPGTVRHLGLKSKALSTPVCRWRTGQDREVPGLSQSAYHKKQTQSR